MHMVQGQAFIVKKGKLFDWFVKNKEFSSNSFCVLIGLAHLSNLILDFISLDLHRFEQPVPLHSCTSPLFIFHVSVYLCLPTVPVYHLCLL